MTTASNNTHLTDGPILLVGGNGMLARAWRELLDEQNCPYTAVDLPEFDITDSDSISQHLTEQYKLVINCAAYTNVDGAESDEATASVVNGTGVGLLATQCAELNIPLVHYSTDYVFDGNATEPYRTDEPRKPIGVYGHTKAIGEQLIEESGCPYLIIRTSWLYAPWGNNFIRTMAKLTTERDELKVVNDQRGRPTSAQHLARTTYDLLKQNAEGIYHVCDGGECTWYELTCEIAHQLGNTCDIAPCTTDQFPRPAPRPAYSVLDLTKTEQLVGPMPPWQQNLADVLQKLESES